MPIHMQVQWPEGLRDVKGGGVEGYVERAKALRAACTACRAPFVDDELRSLVVQVTPTRFPDGSIVPTLVNGMAHARCSGPLLHVAEQEDAPVEQDAPYVLSALAVGEVMLPVLAWSLGTAVVRTNAAGDDTHVDVTELLGAGFLLSTTDDLEAIVRASFSSPAPPRAHFTARDRVGTIALDEAPAGLSPVVLGDVDLSGDDEVTAAFLSGLLRPGYVLAITGPGLALTGNPAMPFDLTAPLAAGNLVIGLVPFRR